MRHFCSILRRTNSANAQLGLSILLYPDTQNYAMGMNNFYGFRVLVHSPYNFPEVSGKGFAIPSKKEAFLAVSAQVTERYSAVSSGFGVIRQDFAPKTIIRQRAFLFFMTEYLII